MNKKRLVQTGILFLVSIVLLYWGINFLKGRDVFKTQDVYYAKYNRVDGLLESSPVMLNGYKIGLVSNIQFEDDGSGGLIATIVVPEGFKIPIGTTAKIESIDLMGTKSVSFLLSSTTNYHTPGDTLQSAIEGGLKEQVSMQVAPLKNKAEQLMGSLDSAITVVTYVFNEKSRENLKESFSHINATIANLEKASVHLNEMMQTNKRTIGHILANIDTITTEINTNKIAIAKTVRNLEAFTDTLSNITITPLMAKTENAITNFDSLLMDLKDGNGTFGKLLNDENLYQNMQNATYNLDKLLKDIRINPQRYIHFSAIDLGKDIYISSSDNPVKGIEFRILVLAAKDKVALDSQIFKGNKVEETKIVDTYYYFLPSFTDYNEALNQLEEIQVQFPEAEIFAFKNNRKIKLKRAIRKNR